MRSSRARLWWTFFWLGCTGFGGGIAVLAQIHAIVVTRHRWLSENEYWEAAAFGQSLPGSPAANAIGYIGLRLHGTAGAALAFTAFVMPSFFMMLALTIGYRYISGLPNINILFFGLNAAIVAVVFSVGIKLGRRGLKRRWHWVMAIVSCVALIANVATVVELVLIAGLLGIFIDSVTGYVQPEPATKPGLDKQALIEKTSADLPLPEIKYNAQKDSLSDSTPPESRGKSTARAVALPLLLLFAMGKLSLITQLGLLFLRIGTITFGGGYVMIPIIQEEVVKNAGWLTDKQFIDGMSLGQITPGSVISIASAFVGYYVAGIPGAIVATMAAFLPSFALTVIAGHSLERMRANKQVKAFLQGIAPAIVGMLVAAAVSLGRAGIHSLAGLALAAVAAVILLRTRANPALVMLGSALVGLFLNYLSLVQ